MTAAWTGRDGLRAMKQVQRLHDCGPRSCFELLREFAADPIVRADLDALLQRYSRITPAMIDSVDARELRLPLAVIENDPIAMAPSAHRLRGAA